MKSLLAFALLLLAAPAFGQIALVDSQGYAWTGAGSNIHISQGITVSSPADMEAVRP